GQAVRDAYAGTRTVLGGVFAVADAEGVAVEPLLAVSATPAGVVSHAAFEHLVELLLERLEAQPDADAALLDLHGAMVTDQLDDPEGYVIEAVRAWLGDRPLAVVFDLHANLSAREMTLPEVVVGYDLYPHTDLFDRGAEAARLVIRAARGEIKPTKAWRKLPLLTMPPRQCTLVEPMRSVLGRMWAMEAAEGVLSATVCLGFPFSDIPDVGASIVVTTDSDPDLAEAKADELASFLWERRGLFEVDLVPVEAVIRYTERAEGTVVLADGSDNPGGGAPCDGTFILESLIEAAVPDAVVAVIADPETAYQAHEAGVGASIHARLGGKTDDRHGRPIELEAYVKHLSDGRFTYRAEMAKGSEGMLGPSAVLESGGIKIIVSSERTQVWDPEILRCMGIEPTEHKLIVLKSAVHFRAAFGPLADRIFDADSPGVHRPDFAAYHYQRIRRPIYPLDPDTVFELAERKATA
ncbi:MAG: M81 family metallopeptidase, partial [Armatimonadetes bacterium]|nr:M81 family metallopeptidase [Armatimonadota bacterium]